MKKDRLNEALARKQVLQKKKVTASGSVAGWMFNDKLALIELGFYDKKRQAKPKDYNALDTMR